MNSSLRVAAPSVDMAPRQDNSENPRPDAEAHHLSIGDIAQKFGITLRALRFYQSKGLLTPTRVGRARLFSNEDCERLALILQGRRLGFTLAEVRDMLAAWRPGSGEPLPISRKKCVEQIRLLERQRQDAAVALEELRQVYTRMFVTADATNAKRSTLSDR